MDGKDKDNDKEKDAEKEEPKEIFLSALDLEELYRRQQLEKKKRDEARKMIIEQNEAEERRQATRAPDDQLKTERSQTRSPEEPRAFQFGEGKEESPVTLRTKLEATSEDRLKAERLQEIRRRLDEDIERDETRAPDEQKPTQLEVTAEDILAAERLQEIRRSIDENIQTLRRRTVQLEEVTQKIESSKKMMEWQQKNKERGHYEQFGFYDKPKKRKCKQYCYDPEDHRFLRRNWREWIRILLFYLVFFCILAIMFAICILTFFRLVKPEYTPFDSSWIMPQPGLSIFPADAYGLSLGSRLKDDVEKDRVADAMGSNRLQFKLSTDDSFAWDRNRVCFRNRMKFMFKRFLEPYKHRPDLLEPGNCTEENLYGFLNNTPCFFLKINRIYNFRFKTYKTFDEIPGDFPLKLRDKLRKKISEFQLDGKAFIDCGPTPSSRYKLGDIAYWPEIQSVDVRSYFYDQNKVITDRNLVPVITIQLLNPKLWTSLGLVCRVWAKNIDIEDENSRFYMGSNKVYINIKDSENTLSKGDQSFWEVLEFPN